MISKKMEKALNEQIGLEGYASFLYLSMSTWADNEGLVGCAQFLKRQSEEEHMHMLKLFDYLAEVDGFALTPGVKQPPHQFDSIQEVDVYSAATNKLSKYGSTSPLEIS